MVVIDRFKIFTIFFSPLTIRWSKNTSIPIKIVKIYLQGYTRISGNNKVLSDVLHFMIAFIDLINDVIEKKFAEHFGVETNRVIEV